MAKNKRYIMMEKAKKEVDGVYKQYEDGLILDEECLRKQIKELLAVYDSLTK